MFGLGCECNERTYQSKWSWDECLQFLNRRNIYDTLEYQFQNGECLYIIFRHALNRFFSGNWHSKYLLIQQTCEEGSMFTVRFVDEIYSFPCLTDKQLDEFFLTKLDATPI